MTQFEKALIFTDLHITAPGKTIIGLDPLARFSQGLAHALDRHKDASHLIILGDLTHNGHLAEYQRLAPLLKDLPVPLTLTMGNHDDREALAQVFGKTGFQNTALDLGNLRLLVLDTLDDAGSAPNEHDGWLCGDRLAWLDAELVRAQAEDRDVVILCHHPPCPVGFWAMDAIGLANGSELLDRAHASGRVKHIICGHIHRTIMASANGLPISVLKSPCHQMPMALGPGTSSDSVDEPGAYGILLNLGDTVVLHTEDFALSTGEVQRYD